MPKFRTIEAKSPQSLFEANDEPWLAIAPLLSERLDELCNGDVMEVVSTNPRHRLDMLDWCRTEGHGLFQMSVDGHQTRFWVAKQ